MDGTLHSGRLKLIHEEHFLPSTSQATACVPLLFDVEISLNHCFISPILSGLSAPLPTFITFIDDWKEQLSYSPVHTFKHVARNSEACWRMQTITCW
jgi:hypothetical protein